MRRQSCRETALRLLRAITVFAQSRHGSVTQTQRCNVNTGKKVKQAPRKTCVGIEILMNFIDNLVFVESKREPREGEISCCTCYCLQWLSHFRTKTSNCEFKVRLKAETIRARRRVAWGCEWYPEMITLNHAASTKWDDLILRRI